MRNRQVGLVMVAAATAVIALLLNGFPTRQPVSPH